MSIDLWTTHSLDKLFPDSDKPPRARTDIVLKAARNETEDAQVALRIPRGTAISKASFSLPDLIGPGGRRIAKRNLSASWIWYTYVLSNPPENTDPSSYLRKAPAFFPDAFLEQSTIAIRDEWTQPLWLSVRVPKRTPAGDYTGSLGIDLVTKEGRKHHFEVPVTVSVWPFTLPDASHLHHTEWFSAEVVADYYHLEPWSEAHWTWLERIAADMARHRQDMVLTPFASLVRVTESKAGRLSYDFSRLDRWAKTFKKAGVGWIEGGHVAGRAGDFQSDIVWNRFPVHGPDGKRLDTSRVKLSEKQFEPYVEGFLKAVHAHIKQRGWGKQYVQHVADEPIPQNEQAWCYRAGKVREWLPGVPVIDAVMSHGLEGYVDWRVPQIQHTGPDVARNPNEELWSYVCLAPQGQYPNRFLDYPSIRNRIIFWLSWGLGLKGFLHWGYAFWIRWQGVPVDVPVSPWLDATGASIYCADRTPLPAGDPHIVYPGRDSICSSIRWEVIRKGIEDFEYLYLLEHAAAEAGKKGDRRAVSAAKRLLARVRADVAPDPLNHTRSEEVLLAAREEAGQLLATLAGED
jgi:hypothetical protein